MSTKLNILLVDDHEVVRAGFKMLLSSYNFIDQILDVSSGEEALRLYKCISADIVVMDLSMPGIGGLETIRRLIKEHPDAIILVYSIHESGIYIEHALQAGAKGYINKNSAAEILAEAIHSVSNGNIYRGSKIDETRLTKPVVGEQQSSYEHSVEKLSPREFDVFCLLAKGLNAHEISENLCLGYKTVANYSTKIKNKLNANTIVELTHIAMASGILKV